jgi:hypothetical protein
MIISSDVKFQNITNANNMTSNAINTGEEVNKDSFKANDVIDWQVLGKASTSLPTTFLVTSSQGLMAQVSIASGHMLRVDQTSKESLDFCIGDALLSTGYGNPGPITIVFEQPVYGINMRIHPDVVNDDDYSVSIEAFDRLDCSINKIKHTALTQKLDNGAIPLTLLDKKGRVKKLVISAKELGIHNPFAINSMELRTISIA